MKDRLLKFLNKQKLSSARFAEIIDVQPSSISHILSGRNKPGFEFIRKTLINFPSLNSEWLILGKGTMFKNEDIQGDLFAGNIIEGKEKEAGIIEDPEEPDRAGTDDGSSGVEPPARVTDVNKADSEDDYIGKGAGRGLLNDVNTGKSVQRIVIFYSDKSFSEYFPE